MKELKLKIPEGQRAGQALINFLHQNRTLEFYETGGVSGQDIFFLTDSQLTKLWNETFKH